MKRNQKLANFGYLHTGFLGELPTLFEMNHANERSKSILVILVGFFMSVAIAESYYDTKLLLGKAGLLIFKLIVSI